jgi:C-terminal processing protease CtpA/Prc
VEVQRGKLTSTGKLKSSTIPGTNYSYLLFPPVGYATLQQDVAESMQKFSTDKKLEGLVIDLRIASSSRGWPLEDMFTMFHDGPLGEFFNRNEKQLVEVTGQDTFSSQKIPLVVLVGQNTSGFPEIFAASLQMHERAVVIGETTPGAVETTSDFYLPDGSQAFIATTSFVLPNGNDIGTTGVIPDVPITAGWDDVLPDNDPVLDRAVEALDEQQ